jgi:two-component system response regulator LytT
MGMDKIKCVIVEDEIPSAEELKYVLSQYSFLEIKGIAYDNTEALHLINNVPFDVAFLDINIPLGSGMDLAKHIKDDNRSLDIVFVTAYNMHAIEAFEIQAFDYILKPFDEKRIATTINRLKEKYINNTQIQNDMADKISEIINNFNKVDINLKRIPCEENGIIKLIDVDTICYCYIVNEKTYVKTYDKSYFTNYILSKIETKTNFLRVHRSYLVNIDKIKELYSWFDGTYKLVINDDEKTEIPVSRSNVRKLKELLGI